MLIILIPSLLALSNFDPGSLPTIKANVFLEIELDTIPPFSIIEFSKFCLDIAPTFPVIT